MAINKAYESLCERFPELTPQQMLADLVPPREFRDASFATYKPDARYPSQSQALKECSKMPSGKTSFFAKKDNSGGVYLDGGFGVGKTHLLASIFHAYRGTKLFGSFLAFTSFIGAVGFAESLKLLSKFELICIDEFELDDPGNTMIMSRVLNELAASGTRFAATSNTPPNALGEGRFAAADFQREIQGIGSAFNILRIDGEDYRHRPFDAEHRLFTAQELDTWASDVPSSSDRFKDLLLHLSRLHPSRYGKLLHGLGKCVILEATPLTDEFDALRFVALVDRAYESQVKIRSSGTPLTEIFPEKFLHGGYRKKYLRAISRLGALAS